jgi:hypothetical protein
MGYFQVPDSEPLENASKQNLVSTISPSEALADLDPARRLEFFGFYPALTVNTHKRQ